MALNLNSIMLGSEDPKRLADFYTKVLGAPNPDWSDDTNGWFGFQVGDVRPDTDACVERVVIAP